MQSSYVHLTLCMGSMLRLFLLLLLVVIFLCCCYQTINICVVCCLFRQLNRSVPVLTTVYIHEIYTQCNYYVLRFFVCVQIAVGDDISPLVAGH